MAKITYKPKAKAPQTQTQVRVWREGGWRYGYLVKEGYKYDHVKIGAKNVKVHKGAWVQIDRGGQV